MTPSDTIFRKQDDDTIFRKRAWKSSTLQLEFFNPPVPIAKYLLKENSLGVYTITTGFKVDLSKLPLDYPIVTSVHKMVAKVEAEFPGYRVTVNSKSCHVTAPCEVKELTALSEFDHLAREILVSLRLS
jgi:hypothetical protein